MQLYVGASVGEGTAVLVQLVAILAGAKWFAEVFERLRQPAVAGEILAGVILGPSILGWIAPSETVTLLSEIGVIFLLFNVGLETKPSSCRCHGHACRRSWRNYSFRRRLAPHAGLGRKPR